MKKSRRLLLAGVTLAELVVALAALGVGTSITIALMLQLNRNATLSRLRTGAGTVAQNQIDDLLSIQPFNPQKSQTPPELALGTIQQGTSTAPTVPIYTDPVSGLVTQMGWMTTTVTDMNQSLNGVSYNLRQAVVTVSYNFHGKVYSVSFTTMRGSDI
jgi:hypothetical protein